MITQGSSNFGVVLSIPMITPMDWSKCVNEVLLPIDKNSSVPSLEILNEFPSVIEFTDTL